MHRLKRIAIHHPRGTAIWADILRGVFRYARPDKPWLFCANFENSIDNIKSWQPDGVIAQCNNRQEQTFLKSLNVPIVNFAREISSREFPSVQIDDEQVGVMAAEYFLRKAFTHFAYVGLDDRDFMVARAKGFCQRVSEDGYEAVRCRSEWIPMMDQFGPPNSQLQKWVTQLRQPTALFVGTDALALVMSQVCRSVDIKIPDQIAILGVSNNDLLCNLEYPPISSIRVPGEALGIEAARKMDRLLEGEQDDCQPTRLPPIGVVTRQSTDIYAIEDAVVCEALAFIRDHARQPMNVNDVVRALAVSRSTLERKFRDLLQRSVLDEIRNRRIENAKAMMHFSDKSLSQIALDSGFGDAKQFSSSFTRIVGQTPSEYRRNVRGF